MLKKLLYRFLPTSVVYRILDWRENMRGAKKIYYSQFGEDVVLENLTKKQKRGFYIDIGANHPKISSNTFLLYKRGWHGINIEPDPFLISLLKRARPRDICIQAGIGNASTLSPYYRFSDSRVSTFSKERAEALITKGLKLIEQQDIPVQPLFKVLESYILPPVDVMNVDVEDLDEQVLQTNDWNKIHPKIVVIESRGFDLHAPEKDSIYIFLTKKGYTLHSKVGYSLVFVSKAFTP